MIILVPAAIVAAAAEPVPVDTALAKLAAAYSGQAVADTVTAEITRDDGTIDRVSLLIESAGTGHERSIRIVVDQFTVWAAEGVIRAERATPGTTGPALSVRREGLPAPEMLTAIIPLGPLPQLWTIEPGGQAHSAALGPILFEAADRQDGLISITGSAAARNVRLTIDADSGRVASLFAAMRDGSVMIRATPATPSAPETWPISVEGRRIVERLDQLSPSGPPIEVGSMLPDLILVREGLGRPLSAIVAEATSEPAAPWTILILAQPESVEDAHRAAGTIAAAAAARSKTLDPTSAYRLRHRSMVIEVVREDFPGTAAVQPTDRAGLRSSRPDLTLDRLPQAAGPIAIAIDSARVVGAMQPLERPENVGALLDQMLIAAQNPAQHSGE
jgi:hypothetical protein